MAEKLAHEAAINRYIEKTTEKALLLHTAGCTNQAIDLFTDLLALNVKNDEILFNLAKLRIVTGDDEEAGSLLNRISEQSSHYIDALFLLGIMSAENRGFSVAAEYYRRVLALDDNHVEAHNNLGLCLTELMQLDEALFHYIKALELAPERHETYNNVGNLLVLQWKLTEAVGMYAKAIDKKNDDACAYSNLGRIASYEGRIDDAVALFLKALDIQPDFRAAADSLLFILNNSDRYTPEQISKEHFRLSAIYPASTAQKSNRKCNNKTKIRVGYVSPDFKSHSVGFFIEPVLKQHSKEDFEIYCYDHVSVPDETTERMKSFVGVWRPIFGLSDLEVANLVEADDIDILVDLAGHSKGNRLGVFALQPAPTQVTWLGYPNTTGLKQVDYRLTDSFADPPGMTEHLYSERLIRLPRSFLCYTPALSTPEVADLPGQPVVFCCFNNYPKMSDTILALWARILHAVPGVTLLLKSAQLGDSGVRARLTSRFAAHGIDSAQLVISGFEDKREEHLQRYGSCHIALDTFPYNGTTTTCEALWMGVPVVTLAGRSHVSRVGASIMNNIGMPELVATNIEQYVNVAVSLANDPVRIQNCRNTLRAKLSNSHLMDAVSFTGDLEKSYRWMLGQARIDV